MDALCVREGYFIEILPTNKLNYSYKDVAMCKFPRNTS